MTITRETLELAAKAAGYEVYAIRDLAEEGEDSNITVYLRDANQIRAWNPEHDDGDSARLGTDLMLGCQFGERFVLVLNDKVAMYEYYDLHDGDKHKALRIARLRVAAEIGRRME